MRKLLQWRVLLLLLAVSAAWPACAQSGTEVRLREALRDTAARLRTAEAALAEQQLATAAVERERDALKARPTLKVDAGREATLQSQLTRVNGELAQSRAEEQKWRSAEQQASQLAQKREAEHAALTEQLARTRAQSAQCAANTEVLYKVGREIAALYRDPAFIDFVRSHGRELLGIDRVRDENRVRALEDRLVEAYAQSQSCGASVAAVEGGHP
jgi:hypothetical protein